MSATRERRLLGAAAGLVVAGLAAVPFAGGWASPRSLVATGPGHPSTAVAPSTTPTTDAAAAALLPPPSADDAAVAPPPIDVTDIDAGVGGAPDEPTPELPEPSPPPATNLAVEAPVDPGPTAPATGADAPPPDAGVIVAQLPTGPSGPAAQTTPPSTTTTTTEPPPTTTTTTAPPTDAIAAEPERVWAVSIGIDDYPGTAHDLRAARSDAMTVTDTLVNLGVPPDHVREVVNGGATLAGVLAAADWLVAHAGPDDIAIFFYAGHVREFGAGTELIVTAEGGWIADWYLGQAFAPLAAHQAWMVIAGCYGGGFDELLAPGRILTGAAPPGVLAYENDFYHRSYLVEWVFERALLHGAAGVPTVQAAVQWAMDDLGRVDPVHQIYNIDRSDELISVDGARRGPAPGSHGPPSTAPPCAVPGLVC